MKTKIGFLSTNQEWGGSESLWSAAALRALEANLEVQVVVHSGLLDAPAIASLSGAGAQTRIIEPGSSSATSLYQRVIRRVNRGASFKDSNWYQSLTQGVEILCISQGTWDEVLWHHGLCEAILELQIPYICLLRSDSSRDLLSSAQRELGREFYSRATCLIPASKSTVEVAELGLACGLDNIYVLHSPIRRVATEAKKIDNNASAVFGCVGRLQCANKGQHLLLKTLALPSWKARNWLLYFYGLGPDKQYLKELSTFFGLNDRIIWKGHVDNLYDVMSCCDIFVQPSIVEGMPQSVLEAMACAKPVVATAIGGIPDWIDDGITGFLAPSPSPKHLNEALEKAWKFMPNWGAIGLRAREMILSSEDRDPAQSLLDLIVRALG